MIRNGYCYASITVVKINDEIFAIFPLGVPPVALYSMTRESVMTVTMKILRVDLILCSLSSAHSIRK